jgi:hypothetical protein
MLLGVQTMYSLINRNAGTLLDLLSAKPHVKIYCELLERLHQVNVAEDDEFKGKYKAFWAMNVARLSDDFTAAYFTYLEQHKTDVPASSVEAAVKRMEDVAKYLHAFPTGPNGKQSLQFSFASKLVHMIDPARPVYDRMVERFYFLPTGTETGIDRLPLLMGSYEFLTKEYHRIIDKQLLQASIELFRVRFPGANLPREKIIDSLIWSFVDWLQKGKGAIPDGRVVYA